MTILKAFHVKCDSCGIFLHNATCGEWVRQAHAVNWARLKGWTHGKRDLCPRCRKTANVPQTSTKVG